MERERGKGKNSVGEKEDKISPSNNFSSMSPEKWYWMAWGEYHKNLGLDRCTKKNPLNTRAVLKYLCTWCRGQQGTQDDSLHTGIHSAIIHLLFLP